MHSLGILGLVVLLMLILRGYPDSGGTAPEKGTVLPRDPQTVVVIHGEFQED